MVKYDLMSIINDLHVSLASASIITVFYKNTDKYKQIAKLHK